MIDDFLVNIVNLYYNIVTFRFVDSDEFIKVFGIPLLILYTFPWFYLFLWISKKLSYNLRFWVIFGMLIFITVGDLAMMIVGFPMFFIYIAIHYFKDFELNKKRLKICLLLIMTMQMPLMLATNYIMAKCHYKEGSNVEILDNNISVDSLTWIKKVDEDAPDSYQINGETYPLYFKKTYDTNAPYGVMKRDIFLKTDNRLLARDHIYFYSSTPWMIITHILFNGKANTTIGRGNYCRYYDDREVVLKKLTESVKKREDKNAK